jgi:hypothetical protein
MMSSGAGLAAVIRCLCVAAIVGAVLQLRAVALAPDNGASTAMSILRGHHFDLETLRAQANRRDKASPVCAGRRMRHWLIVRSQLASALMQRADIAGIDVELWELDRRSRNLLACYPRDGLGWLTLAWIEMNSTGVSEATFQKLRNSYAFAPREGWIAAQRNRLVLQRYGSMPPDLRDRAVAEFVELLEGRFVDESVATFLSLKPALQALLIARSAGVSVLWQTKFQQALKRLGVEIRMPGVAVKPDRPWL